jgi:hypothetical protein
MAKDRKRLVVLFAGATLAVIVCSGTAGVVLDRYLDPFDAQPFDPEVWAGADSQSRGKMARDAIRHLAAGLTAARFRELLGPPEAVPGLEGMVDGFGNQIPPGETWAYYLGCWSSLTWYGFDSAFLYVHFDHDGRVATAQITGG